MMKPAPSVTGRFAPSPTGPLHYGSLLAALASYLQTRHHGGRWLVRVEDLDPPREVPGATADILRTLEGFCLHWDGEVVYQSRRGQAYREVLADLASRELSYECTCTRSEIQARGERVYLGHCRSGCNPRRSRRAVRLRVGADMVRYCDLVQGAQASCLARTAGDFVIHRADGLFAYQLAVVVDDAEQGVTEVIRGADLLDSTPRQIYLQRLLGLPTPRYGHIPVAVNPRGEKLSKQTGATAVRATAAGTLLYQALRDLGQQPPAALAGAAPEEQVAWGIQHWRLAQIPRRESIPAASPAGLREIKS